MKKIAFIFLSIFLVSLSVAAQLPNGFNRKYKLAGMYDSSGCQTSSTAAAPEASVLIVTTNFGFIQSSAILSQNFGYVGSNQLTYDSYAGVQNGWHVYVQDMGIAGRGYLLITQDGSRMRYIGAWDGGNYADYIIK